MKKLNYLDKWQMSRRFNITVHDLDIKKYYEPIPLSEEMLKEDFS
jgi:hypothetical protein